MLVRQKCEHILSISFSPTSLDTSHPLLQAVDVVTFRSVVRSSISVTLRVLLLLQKCCTARLGVVVRCCHQYNINFKSMLLDFYICFAGKKQLKIQSKAVCSLTFYFQTVALSVLHMQLLHVIK